MKGTLYGVGVGPGDPELLTLKAARLLDSVPVVAYPAPLAGEGMARTIAAAHIGAGKVEIAIRMSFDPAEGRPEAAYDAGAAAIAGHLAAGRDVALLCEGDPLLFGSFIPVLERVAGAFPVVVVPGISAPAACAAAVPVPLASGEQSLLILPATRPEADLERDLAGAAAAAVMKVGRHLPKLRRVLDHLGRLDDAWLVERAGLPEQRVARLREVETAPYFATVLVAQRPIPAPAAQAGGLAVVLLSPAGLETARRIREALPEARLHGLASRVTAADVVFGDASAHLRRLFAEGTAIVGVCAAGILIRALAPVLADKRAEPPVLAVATDGGAAVPLLGGHRGANALANRIADALGGAAALTTAGEVAAGLALDSPPDGWRIANPEAVKPVAAALLAGAAPRLIVEAGDPGWLSGLPRAEGARLGIRITDRAVAGSPDELVFHPPVLALGVGCERGAEAAELESLARETLAAHDLSPAAVACVVSVDLKADEPAVNALAAALDVPARFFTPAELEAQAPRLANPSEVVFRETGCHGVAEGAALAAAGADGELIVAKTKSRRATCAVARAPHGIAAAAVGRARGRLSIVGIGPGPAEWRTPEAERALAEAEEVVGYRLYLDLLGGAIAGKGRHDSPLGSEEERVRAALELAAAGRRVALVSSGDAGIYGLATLAFELLDRGGRADWRRIEIAVAPGVSALQAAAARLGAPLNHDFCAISLSDLLTPWQAIERRLEAAAAGDFVVALYNPVSRRRRDQLVRARDILLAARPGETPVALARNLGRPGETVETITLAELTPDHADMLTLVLIGSSETRAVDAAGRRWLYTPRGYAGKAAGET